ncbi:iron complex transport system permease protein [Labedella gwakjiensis]|uniref:Iron complex transport system permease protein n=2 Tax=Labedella gwakjiensis TaxID=390269 RepID=A0A2P8GWE7_9MICO|nr:iron chelate uptake ABC transporter family permease subunit [Labedella gwakjiensis]PSL38290.1 iron complex transport system permease protein [Labedella gwakjiensis]
MTREHVIDAPPAVGAPSGTSERLRAARRQRGRRRAVVMGALAIALLIVFLVTLSVGNTFYSPIEVVRVILGEQVPGASFTVGTLRLPRAITGLLAGIAFGLAGVTFQTMLRNALASPDVIGITSGASAAAVFAITVLGLGGAGVSVLAVVCGLATALVIYLLAYRNGLSGARLILIGIGVGAMLDSVVSYLLLKSNAFEVQAALRWLTGSLNSAFWDGVPPLAISLLVLLPAILLLTRRLTAMQLGDDSATALGVRVDRTRLLLVVVAVALAGVATATTGPIAFVAFLSGPIASRLVGGGRSLLIPAGLVGGLLVLTADLLGQFAFDTSFPVGVVTGAIGAPYLLYLLIRSNRSGGSL